MIIVYCRFARRTAEKNPALESSLCLNCSWPAACQQYSGNSHRGARCRVSRRNPKLLLYICTRGKGLLLFMCWHAWLLPSYQTYANHTLPSYLLNVPDISWSGQSTVSNIIMLKSYLDHFQTYNVLHLYYLAKSCWFTEIWWYKAYGQSVDSWYPDIKVLMHKV